MRIGVCWKAACCRSIRVSAMPSMSASCIETATMSKLVRGAGIECLAPVRREVQGGADLGQAVAEYGAIQARVVDQQDVHEVFRDLEIAAGTK
jgi:hypothetical protein